MLEIKNLTKTFGGVCALRDLSIYVNKGDILGLIGPNGAGKTVLINIIAGHYRSDKGEVLFNGENMVGLRPDVIVDKGIARTFQHSNLFFENTVKENVLLGLQRYSKIGLQDVFFNRWGNARKQSILEQKAKEVLNAEGLLKDFGNAKAKSIPYGLQKRLSLVMALGCKPTLLLLDETFCGLNPSEVDEMIEVVKKVYNSGITLILIEHNMKVIKALCKRVVVLNFGSKIAEESPPEIEQNEAVIKAYLGD